ncbi:MAG: glycoside hydrolase family 9 protein [Limisphaerales bacterium]
MTTTVRDKSVPKILSALCGFLLVHAGFGQEIKPLVNHLGYEKDAPKRAVVLGHPDDEVTAFKIIGESTGATVLSGSVEKAGPVHHWKDWHFWTADFSPIRTEGSYFIECETSRGIVRSFPFLIERDLLERNTLSGVIYYFKGQRCSGLLDKADRQLRFDGATNAVDLHGGWYDATGDYGKHLAGLSFSTYLNMQPLPVADWCLFQAYRELNRRGDPSFRQFKRRLLDEAMFGADFLVRMKSPNGSFYRTVDAPGPEKRPEDRHIGKEGAGFAIQTRGTKNKLAIGNTDKLAGRFPLQVGYRSGAGVAIAALAAASALPASGEFSNAVYLKIAEDAFAFLEKNNLAFANDGKENILDDGDALLASVELFKATGGVIYRSAAERRARNLMGRLSSGGQYTNYWRADDGSRPFFHPVDAGIPVISLLQYYEITAADSRADVLATVKKSLQFELFVTSEVNNPFGYARQLVQSTNGFRRTAFFFPHDTETAPWWQGENARLGSMAAAARLAARYFRDDPAFHDKLEAYAWNQLNWILGLNPYDCCMLHGTGRNNVAYMFFESNEYHNAPGGICNGITGGRLKPDDIDFNVGFAVTGQDEDWRWSEQWLPHAAWYLYVISVER